MVPSGCHIRPVKVFVNNPLLLKNQEVVITRNINGILSEHHFEIQGLHPFEGWFILAS